MMRIPLSLLYALYAHQSPLASSLFSHPHQPGRFELTLLSFSDVNLNLWEAVVLYNANNLRFLQDIHCIRVNYVQITTYLFMRTIVADIGPNSYDVHHNNSVPINFNNHIETITHKKLSETIQCVHPQWRVCVTEGWTVHNATKD